MHLTSSHLWYTYQSFMTDIQIVDTQCIMCVTYILRSFNLVCAFVTITRKKKCCKHASKQANEFNACKMLIETKKKMKKKQPKKCWLSFRQTLELITHSIFYVYVSVVDRKGEKMKIYEE